ncbi:MAG: mechanosensitive ion channel family protein [Candidatus Binatia bacterium]
MDTEPVSAMRDGFRDLGRRAGELLPEILAALALVVAGAILARWLRTWSARLLNRVPWAARGRGIDLALRRIGIERPVGDVVGAVLFWVVFVIFLTAATEALGLPVVTTWFRGVANYLPRVLLAVLIVFAGLLGGALAREAVATAASAAGIEQRVALGRVAQAVIILIALVTAIDQLGVDSQFFTLMVTIIVGSAIGGTALAFGLGARTTVSNIIACHYLRQTYRVGQVVKIGDAEGRIAEITTTAVVLEVPEGRVFVPAKEFSETASVLLTGGR